MWKGVAGSGGTMPAPRLIQGVERLGRHLTEAESFARFMRVCCGATLLAAARTSAVVTHAHPNAREAAMAGAPLAALARQMVDPEAAVSWELRYYQRDPGGLAMTSGLGAASNAPWGRTYTAAGSLRANP